MNYIEQFLKDNDIEINEEFYVVNLNGDIIEKFKDDRFHFGVGMFLFNKGTALPQDDVLCELLLGSLKIEKIPQKPKTVWDLKNDDEYYCINMYGSVSETTFSNDTRNEDEKIIKAGNAFLTKEEAEFETERRKCEAILLKYGTRNFMSFEYYDDKYYIMYNNTLENVYVDCCNFMQIQGSIYFKTEELAQKAIDEVTEELLKKYIFNVKE